MTEQPFDLDAVRDAYYQTRSVEETARLIGTNCAVAHRLIIKALGYGPIGALTFHIPGR